MTLSYQLLEGSQKGRRQFLVAADGHIIGLVRRVTRTAWHAHDRDGNLIPGAWTTRDQAGQILAACVAPR